LDKFEKRRKRSEEGFRVNSGVACGMKAVGDPDANPSPEGGHVC